MICVYKELISQGTLPSYPSLYSNTIYSNHQPYYSVDHISHSINCNIIVGHLLISLIGSSGQKLGIIFPLNDKYSPSSAALILHLFSTT